MRIRLLVLAAGPALLIAGTASTAAATRIHTSRPPRARNIDHAALLTRGGGR